MNDKPRAPLAVYDHILAEIGRIVHNFNNLENCFRRLLCTITSSDDKHWAITIHMTNGAIIEAVKTIANDFFEGDERAIIHHCSSLFDRIRIDRNFYIHGFRGIDLVHQGMLISSSARGRIVDNEIRVTKFEVADFADACHEAFVFIMRVEQAFDYNRRRKDPDDNTAQGPEMPFPDKPPLPEALDKPRQFRISAKPPP